MILLKTSDDGNGGIRQQEFYFISAPQGSLWAEDYTAYIVDDITGENITNQSYTTQSYGDYIKVNFEPVGLQEGMTYSLWITNNDVSTPPKKRVVYKDKIFVTDQEINQVNEKSYNINKGNYIEKETSTNDYIVL
jgi:hypothetical protein